MSLSQLKVYCAPVTFCDCSGLNAFLHAAQQTTVALRVHPPPTAPRQILDLASCGFLLLGLPFGHPPVLPGDVR